MAEGDNPYSTPQPQFTVRSFLLGMIGLVILISLIFLLVRGSLAPAPEDIRARVRSGKMRVEEVRELYGETGYKEILPVDETAPAPETPASLPQP
jgi:hypothetical protein